MERMDGVMKKKVEIELIKGQEMEEKQCWRETEWETNFVRRMER